MKMKAVLLSLLSTVLLTSGFAQVETDDMYFNSNDRAKLREARKADALAMASETRTRRDRDRNEEELNPTDSYSARNVNPEYVARESSNTDVGEEEEYFVNNYRYHNQDNYNNWNNNFNSWYGSSWYRPNYWSPSIYGWNSPYYGSGFDAWGNPWGNPYYQSGWSASFSYHYGSAWNYGWGFNNCIRCGGFNNGWYGWDPYYSFNPYWGSPMGYWGSPYYARPGRVIVVEDNRPRPTYGKRGSRSAQFDRDTNGSVRSSTINDNRGRNSGGRSRSSSVDSPWRNTRSTSSPNTPYNSGNSNTRSSWESNVRQSSPSFSSPSPSRSSGSSGASRSSGSSGGSGSRSSRSRGGN